MVLELLDQYYFGEQYLDEGLVPVVLNGLADATSSTWTTRHGAVLALSSMLRHNASAICASSLSTITTECLKSALKDEKVRF